MGRDIQAEYVENPISNYINRTLAGGVISVVLGLTTLPDLIIVWNATFTFVSVIVITLVFDEAGLFEYIAIRIARYSGQ